MKMIKGDARSMLIDDLELSPRARTCLIDGQCLKTVGDLVDFGYERVRRTPKLGPKTFREIVGILEDLGLRLKDDPEDAAYPEGTLCLSGPDGALLIPDGNGGYLFNDVLRAEFISIEDVEAAAAKMLSKAMEHYERACLVARQQRRRLWNECYDAGLPRDIMLVRTDVGLQQLPGAEEAL